MLKKPMNKFIFGVKCTHIFFIILYVTFSFNLLSRLIKQVKNIYI